MTTPKSWFTAVGACLALVAALTLATASASTPQTKSPPGPDVRVVNSETEPVPVVLQGAAHIDTSTPLPVTDVDRLSREPVQQLLPNFGEFQVPADKWLVIEHVSGTASINAPESHLVTVGVYTALQGVASDRHVFPLTVAVTKDDYKAYAFGGPLRAYAGPGTKVTTTYSVVGNSSSIVMGVTFSGYLVDRP